MENVNKETAVQRIIDKMFKNLKNVYDIASSIIGEENVYAPSMSQKDEWYRWLEHVLTNEYFTEKEIEEYYTGLGFHYKEKAYDYIFNISDDNDIDGWNGDRHKLVFPLILRYPEVTLKNNFTHKTYKIKDLYVKFYVDFKGKLYDYGISMFRTNYTSSEILSKYIHSHVDGTPDTWNSICIGNSKQTISKTMKLLMKSSNPLLWVDFINQIGEVISKENEYGCYTSFTDITDGLRHKIDIDTSCVYYNIDNSPEDLIIYYFAKYLYDNKILDYKIINGLRVKRLNIHNIANLVKLLTKKFMEFVNIEMFEKGLIKEIMDIDNWSTKNWTGWFSFDDRIQLYPLSMAFFSDVVVKEPDQSSVENEFIKLRNAYKTEMVKNKNLFMHFLLYSKFFSKYIFDSTSIYSFDESQWNNYENTEIVNAGLYFKGKMIKITINKDESDYIGIYVLNKFIVEEIIYFYNYILNNENHNNIII